MNDGMGRARRLGVAAIASVVLIGASGRAHAGGFEAPGIGTEAMGRGGAFTAKADDGSALEYNIAGFARQRGWRLYLDGRLSIHGMEFTRSGVYEGPADVSRPWQGQPYPTIRNEGGISGAPIVALSTDFDKLERWTFVLGLTTPSASDARRTYPGLVNGNWPAPQRYDLQHAHLLVVYPTLAAAVRVTKWLDIGLAIQAVYGTFDLKATAYADLGPMVCADPTDCDSTLNIKTKGASATAALGVMAHPWRGLHLGLHVRGPIYIPTSGDVTATTPPGIHAPLDPGDVNAMPPKPPARGELTFRMPWVVRMGIRYAFMKDQKREQGDIELDGTYESWKQAQGVGDVLSVPSLGPFVDIKATLVHRYKDTGSVRLGGAYNVWFKDDSMLALRLGLFYDSAASPNGWTRIDFDALDKIGYAFGLGYRIRGVGVNVAYTYVMTPERVVTEGRQQVINGTNGTTWNTAGTAPLPIINNGTYNASTHLVFLSLSFAFDELLKKQRTFTY